MADEVRQGRNFIRKGDPIRVRLGGYQFRRGFTFLEWDEREQKARVRTPTGSWRYVDLDDIRRMAVSRQR